MKIEQHVIDELIAQARKDAPNESCGYLLGVPSPQSGEDEGKLVTENYWMENIDHSPEHFAFAPRDQFAALRYARERGLKILANWHSHPASPSRPSEEDLRLAWATRTYAMPYCRCSTTNQRSTLLPLRTERWWTRRYTYRKPPPGLHRRHPDWRAHSIESAVATPSVHQVQRHELHQPACCRGHLHP